MTTHHQILTAAGVVDVHGSREWAELVFESMARTGERPFGILESQPAMPVPFDSEAINAFCAESTTTLEAACRS